MFSKAKRFEPPGTAPSKSQPNNVKKSNINASIDREKIKVPSLTSKTPIRTKSDVQSKNSSIKSVKSFVTPKPVKPVTKAPSSCKKTFPGLICTQNNKLKITSQDDVMKAQEVEIRNKNYTIEEYVEHIEELKNEIALLYKQLKEPSKNNNDDFNNLNKQLSSISLDDAKLNGKSNETNIVYNLKQKIIALEQQCDKLEQEVSSKQIELNSLEGIITIRDSLCKDLQDKLTNMESCLEEARQRLEMVKGHHALALEANESIRREYKAELETLKTKHEEEKQQIISKFKTEQDCIIAKYNALTETIRNQSTKEKEEAIQELQQQLTTKDKEMKAKLEQIDESTREKLRLCEIQFEERSRNLQDHWSQQQKQLQYLEKEANDLKYNLSITEEQNVQLHTEINLLKAEIETLRTEKLNLIIETDELKEESKKKLIEFENQINKLTLEVDTATKEKNKFDMSLSVTRDIVQVLTMRLRESDNELEHLESQMQSLKNSKELLENELTSYKNSLNNTLLECNEYKEALVNILKSKAALAKEHTRIMEHNVTLIESLQNVEKEAYRELGTIKNELIEDVELLKQESKSQIQMLREEVERKRVLCELATEHAGQATVAAEQSRALLAQAANEIARLEAENKHFQQQIQDQQSLVVELSLLRQENEELTMAMAKQSSIMDRMKKDVDQIQSIPKSPSVTKKTLKTGKENLQVIISPLRERNY